MGYTLLLVSRAKPILIKDFHTAITGMSNFNKIGPGSIIKIPDDLKDKLFFSGKCDVHLNCANYVTVSGAFSISGQYAPGFVLDLLLNLQKVGYSIEVLSEDFQYTNPELKAFVEDCMYKKPQLES